MHPDDMYPLLKLKLAARNAEKQIPPKPHWAFCFTMLHKVSRSFALVIQQLGPDLRNARMTQVYRLMSKYRFWKPSIAIYMIAIGISHLSRGYRR